MAADLGKSVYAAGRQRVATVLLGFYFAGACIASGVAGLTAPGGFGTFLTGIGAGAVLDAYSWSLILIGAGGLFAVLVDSREGEFRSVLGVSVLTVINAVSLLPENLPTSLRLMFAPAMMVPYAWMRLGFTLSRKQVLATRQVIEATNNVQRVGDDD